MSFDTWYLHILVPSCCQMTFEIFFIKTYLHHHNLGLPSTRVHCSQSLKTKFSATDTFSIHSKVAFLIFFATYPKWLNNMHDLDKISKQMSSNACIEVYFYLEFSLEHCHWQSANDNWSWSWVVHPMTACMELIFGLPRKMTKWHGMWFNSVSIIPCHPLPYSYA